MWWILLSTKNIINASCRNTVICNSHDFFFLSVVHYVEDIHEHISPKVWLCGALIFVLIARADTATLTTTNDMSLGCFVSNNWMQLECLGNLFGNSLEILKWLTHDNKLVKINVIDTLALNNDINWNCKRFLIRFSMFVLWSGSCWTAGTKGTKGR